MRVTMFAPQRERCGIRDYTDYLLNGLRAQPIIEEVTVVPTPADTGAIGFGEALRRYPVEERRFHARGRAMNAGDIAHVQHQYFFFGGVAPHKNHARAFYSALRVPLVVTVHEIVSPESASSALKRRMLAFANRQNFKHPAIKAYIVHTTDDFRRLEALDIPAKRIHHILHGVPSAEPMPDARAAKRLLNCANRFVVTLFGFLAAKKGHQLVLQAMESLPSDTLLLLAGDRHPDDHTGYVTQLQQEIQTRGLTERVRITGYLPKEQIPTIMAATDVGIAPYLQTSGSGSLANLFAYGRAILASDIAPHREIAQENPVPMLLFRSGDVEEFANHLQRLRAKEELRVAMQQAALSYALQHSYQQMAKETTAVYQRLLSGTDYANRN